MTDQFSCDICGAPLEFIKKLSTYKAKTGLCRRRRYHCPVCDLEVVIYGDGTRDGWRKTEEIELTEEDLSEEMPDPDLK
jgi:hypothetical protein